MQEGLIQGMDGSVKLLEEYLSKGYYVYGKRFRFEAEDLASIDELIRDQG